MAIKKKISNDKRKIRANTLQRIGSHVRKYGSKKRKSVDKRKRKTNKKLSAISRSRKRYTKKFDSRKKKEIKKTRLISKKSIKKISKKPTKKKVTNARKKGIRKPQTSKRALSHRKKHVRVIKKPIRSKRKSTSRVRKYQTSAVHVRVSKKRVRKRLVTKRKHRAKFTKLSSVVKYKLKTIRGKVSSQGPYAKLMQKALEKSMKQLRSLKPYQLGPHINKDGSIDGEIRLLIDGDYLAIFRKLIRYYPRMRGAWIIFIVFFLPEIEEFYDLSDFYASHSIVGTPIDGIPIHASKANDRAAIKGLYARMISERIEEGSGFKPVEIAMRLHWNKKNQRPIY